MRPKIDSEISAESLSDFSTDINLSSLKISENFLQYIHAAVSRYFSGKHTLPASFGQIKTVEDIIKELRQFKNSCFASVEKQRIERVKEIISELVDEKKIKPELAPKFKLSLLTHYISNSLSHESKEYIESRLDENLKKSTDESIFLEDCIEVAQFSLQQKKYDNEILFLKLCIKHHLTVQELNVSSAALYEVDSLQRETADKKFLIHFSTLFYSFYIRKFYEIIGTNIVAGLTADKLFMLKETYGKLLDEYVDEIKHLREFDTEDLSRICQLLDLRIRNDCRELENAATVSKLSSILNNGNDTPKTPVTLIDQIKQAAKKSSGKILGMDETRKNLFVDLIISELQKPAIRDIYDSIRGIQSLRQEYLTGKIPYDRALMRLSACR